MANLTYPFDPVSPEDWVLKIQKELREHSNRTTFHDSIEELTLSITDSPKNTVEIQQVPRGQAFDTIHVEYVHNETESNRRMLLALMSGANALFIQSQKANPDWKKIFEGIETAYIQVDVLMESEQEMSHLSQQLSKDELANLTLLITNKSEINKENHRSFFQGFPLQQCGANSITEMSFLLQEYHRHLSEGGRSEVVFSMGIGANYFVQIAKVRAFHYLIQKLNNIHQQNHAYRIIAELGWTNKSLKDPYTNLLRQTTEAMSAYAGGVHGMAIHPWDEFAAEGKEDFTLRMSLNISNLLLEEAHFDWVHDPMKGSYMVEALTEQFIEKTWAEVQVLSKLTEKEAIERTKEKIQQSQSLQLEAFKSGSQTYIGMNAFMNADSSKAKNWTALPSYWGMNYMNFEIKG